MVIFRQTGISKVLNNDFSPPFSVNIGSYSTINIITSKFFDKSRASFSRLPKNKTQKSLLSNPINPTENLFI